MSDLPTLPNGFVLLGTAIREAGQRQHGPDWIEDGALVALDAELGAASKAWRPGDDVAEGRAKHNRMRTALQRRRAITQSMHPKLIGTPPDYRDAVPVWLRTQHRIYPLPRRIWQHQKIAKDMLGMAEGRPVAFRDHDPDYWPPGTPSTGWLMVAEKDLPRLVGAEPQLTSSEKPAMVSFLKPPSTLTLLEMVRRLVAKQSDCEQVDITLIGDPDTGAVTFDNPSCVRAIVELLIPLKRGELRAQTIDCREIATHFWEKDDSYEAFLFGGLPGASILDSRMPAFVDAKSFEGWLSRLDQAGAAADLVTISPEAHTLEKNAMPGTEATSTTVVSRKRQSPPALKPFWEEAEAAIMEWLVQEGRPEQGDGNQAKLEKYTVEWLDQRGHEAGIATVRRHVRGCIERRKAQLNAM